MKHSSRPETVIIKLGGSIVTHKHRTGVFLRRKRLESIAHELRHALHKNPELRIILIHGAGAGGHQLAKKYRLSNGLDNNTKRWHGAFLTREINQKLNLDILGIFLRAQLPVVPIHTASIIVQKEKHIHSCSFDALNQALHYECIPLLYGELVFDTALGMSICSGDTSAVFLANHTQASRILYASDVDGIFDRDPHRHKDAKFIHSIYLHELLENREIALSGSHSVDVTGGLFNKIAELAKQPLPDSLREVSIFNGLTTGLLEDVLLGKKNGTTIQIHI